MPPSQGPLGTRLTSGNNSSFDDHEGNVWLYGGDLVISEIGPRGHDSHKLDPDNHGSNQGKKLDIIN
jgi:hypothetical protein